MNPATPNHPILLEWFDTTCLQSQAPSNIALIKYMGKNCHASNIPVNASLSYTLNAYRSIVMLSAAEQDQWQPLDDTLSLQPHEQQRCLDHVARVRQWCGLTQPFLVRTTNTFAASCGLASSASSFAALTAAVAGWAQKDHATPQPNWAQWAAWSRHGSGSSCRSFFGPWALWSGEDVSAITLPYTQLTHALIMVDARPKTVSSSAAHRNITTSRYFTGRANRATMRLTALIHAMRDENWHEAYEIIAEEYQDMHQLFETAATPFTYRSPCAKRCITWLSALWQAQGDGPWVTMDAGPNIHLLFRDRDHAQTILADLKRAIPEVTIHAPHSQWMTPCNPM